MSAPRSAHAEQQQRVALIIEREYAPDPDRCVRAILTLLTRRPSASPTLDDETATAATATVSGVEGQ